MSSFALTTSSTWSARSTQDSAPEGHGTGGLRLVPAPPAAGADAHGHRRELRRAAAVEAAFLAALR